MTLLTIFLLAIGLSMDALAVSVCGGVALPAFQRTASGLKFGLWFGAFQALMPVLGYYAASMFQTYIENYDHWVAFLLLVYLGWNMLREAKSSCPIIKSYGVKDMFLLAVATSIDALAVGISFAFLQVNIWQAAVVIGLTTFVFSFVGCTCGTIIGEYGREKAEMAGGIVLIVLGCKILLEHLGVL